MPRRFSWFELSPEEKEFAKDLHAQGMSAEQIGQEMLARFGRKFSGPTIRNWFKYLKKTVEEKLLESKIISEEEALIRLSRTLEVMWSSLDELIERGEGKLRLEDLNKALELIREIRTTLDAIERIRIRIPTKTASPQDIASVLEQIFKEIDLPVDKAEIALSSFKRTYALKQV